MVHEKSQAFLSNKHMCLTLIIARMHCSACSAVINNTMLHPIVVSTIKSLCIYNLAQMQLQDTRKNAAPSVTLGPDKDWMKLL